MNPDELQMRQESASGPKADESLSLSQCDEPSEDWLERFFGAFADAPEFDEVIDFGRAHREAERRAAMAESGTDP